MLFLCDLRLSTRKIRAFILSNVEMYTEPGYTSCFTSTMVAREIQTNHNI